MYKYTFDKSSKKFICPACGKKRFVKYFDNESKSYLENGYGKCDRHTACGHFKKIDGTINNIINNNKPIERKIQFGSIEIKTFTKTLKSYKSNSFVQFLLKNFNENEVKNVIEKYKIGTSKKWNGSPIFWLIDENNIIRSGRIMGYNSDTGKRIKHPFNHITWVHKAIKIKDFNIKPTLFGIHIINHNSKKIAIVESEKTAIIMSILKPQYLWLATGGIHNLKSAALNPLKQNCITCFPDNEGFETWDLKCQKLRKEGFDISCSLVLEDKTIKSGDDIADLFLEVIISNKDHVTNNSRTYYETEIERISIINPAIKLLINQFDLIDENGDEIKY
ncbi:DUF6371 domain-containing protein [Flavobacterium sp.]|jgi:hypothetical protein|uniref:DUF6371 domain-containing protein n=1 Tax=Flavobacterium sp. TaxID=239 RepID=UPI002A8385D3|nr:DUF6371 domain-containing protein [Flavobacterium sp.]